MCKCLHSDFAVPLDLVCFWCILSMGCRLPVCVLYCLGKSIWFFYRGGKPGHFFMTFGFKMNKMIIFRIHRESVSTTLEVPCIDLHLSWRLFWNHLDSFFKDCTLWEKCLDFVSLFEMLWGFVPFIQSSFSQVIW